ncbi:MAG: hypothetical protein K9H14_01995 [Actinomycetia bacterium]|nr:hypothetical protein [Actinomycetes bacterium]
MDDKKEQPKGALLFILGGAAMGAFAGYLINRIGVKNIATLLKAKDIIPPNVADMVKDFATNKLGEK